tara:strand:+ start:127 stop:672 length:546 start_codon:yes stop_codon:yes gene_type:complete
MAFRTEQEKRARREAARRKQAQDLQRIKGWWGRLPRTGSTVAEDINEMPALQRRQAEESAKIARSRATRAAKAAERRRRREVAESATGDGVADDISQAGPMWQRGTGGVHGRSVAGPPSGAGGVRSPGLSDIKDDVMTGAGAYPVYKGAPAQNFRTAFAAARKSGKKTFTWQGRKYTTDVA